MKQQRGEREREKINLLAHEEAELKAVHCSHLIDDFGKLLQCRAHDLVITTKWETLREQEGQSLILKKQIRSLEKNQVNS